MAYNIGPKIGIDGEAEFRRQIKEINLAYKTLQAETKAVTAEFEANGDEMGGLSAKGQQLEKMITNQRDKLKLLEDAVEKATAQYGENSTEATRLKGVMYDTAASVSDLEKQLKDTEKQLESADNAMDDLSDSSEAAGQQIVKFGDMVAANTVGDLIADGVRTAVDKLKDFAVGSVETAAQVRAANSQYSQAFGDMKDQATDALEKISDETDITTTRMQGAYTMLYAFVKTTGADSAEALGIAQRAMSAAADSAAYYDKSIEEVTETLQSFLKGNYENDAALGIAATETTRNAKANELYAKSFNELSESQKVDALLAMVEAGNKASGALGQAARESGSWENVNGELSESLRQLQARIGNAALDKMVPVIQKITEKANELIEDTDWEEFGETVAGILEFAIENGPAAVKAIGAIATGFATFKAAQKAAEIVTLTKSLMGLQTAATAASGPWGIAALAIGAAITAFVALSGEAETVADDLIDGMEKFESSMEQANAQYAETVQEVEGAAYAAEHYVAQLKELEAAGLDTEESQRAYALTVEELNKLIPDLNLEIDEQTGLINKNTDALLRDIDAWKKSAVEKALQEKFTDELEAQGKAEADLIVAKTQRKQLEGEISDLQDKQTQKTKELENARIRLGKVEADVSAQMVQTGMVTQELASEQATWSNTVETLQKECDSLGWELADNQKQYKDLGDAITAGEETVASFDDQIQLARDSMELWGKETGESSEEQDKLQETIAKTQEKVDALSERYAVAAEEARKSIDSQIGLFDELATKSELSAEQIITNWSKQKEAFDNYAANLQKAVDMGLDKMLVEQLSDGSEQSMLILNEFVNGTNVSIDEINAAFGRMDESKNKLSQAIGDMKTDFSSGMDEIEKDAEESGLQIVNGLVKKIQNETPRFSGAMKNLGRYGMVAFNEYMVIESPSKRMAKSAGYIIDGAVNPVEERTKEFAEAMANMAELGNQAFLDKKLNAAVEFPEVFTLPVVSPITEQKQIAHNYGGQTFNIYQQPGEDANDLANRIMRIMQHNVTVQEEAIGLG